MELNELTAHELIERLKRKEITSPDVLTALDKRIRQVNSKVKAYVRVNDFSFSDLRPTTCDLRSVLQGIPISIDAPRG